MKPPTQVLLQALLMLLVTGHIAQEVRAFHAGHKTHHHELHHQGHHEGHHHSPSHHGHHGPRAARTRREKEAPGGLTEKKDDSEATSSWKDGYIQCSVEGQSECSELQRSYCDLTHKVCTCPVEFPNLDEKNKFCIVASKLREQCQFNSECEESDEYSYCGPDYTCACKPGYEIDEFPNVGIQCVNRNAKSGQGNVDPAMIGVLVGLALMFVIICVVLRLFSKARFRENRSIFNTPNPRLMNASLFKDSKLLSPARGERRGSRASVRAPSRAPSVTSVNAATRSPNGSLAKGTVAGRRGSAMSAVSATGSAAGGAPPKTPSPAKEPKTKTETTVAIENVD